MKMTINDLVNALSGSSIQEFETERTKMEEDFPPQPGTVWRFKKYPREKEFSNRILVTDAFRSGVWTTITVVTNKGVTKGDYTPWEWNDTFEPVT
jgi:hypothetical protein